MVNRRVEVVLNRKVKVVDKAGKYFTNKVWIEIKGESRGCRLIGRPQYRYYICM